MIDKQDGHYTYQDLTSNSLLGTKMIQSDTLSRQLDYGAEGQFDDEEKTVLPENLFINLLDHRATGKNIKWKGN
jgi:hypothetical protein